MSACSETLNVQPPSVSLGTPDDPNPTGAGQSCGDGQCHPKGAHPGLVAFHLQRRRRFCAELPGPWSDRGRRWAQHLSCTVWNNAAHPQGEHNSSTSTVTLHIDESRRRRSASSPRIPPPPPSDGGYERRRIGRGGGGSI